MSKAPAIDPNIWSDEIYDGADSEENAHFTVAMDKARQKLEKFQLPDPRYYVLQLIQAFIAAGATDIEITSEDVSFSQGKLSIKFDGPGYLEHELRRMNDALFESGRSRGKDRTRELALGLVSCLALSPKRISFTSHAHRWIRDSAGERVESLYPKGTEIPPWEAHSRSVFEVEQNDIDEICKLVKNYCLSCPVNLTVNDSLVCSKDSLLLGSCPWPNFPFKEGNVQGYFGIAYGQMERTQLVLLRYGVQFAKRSEARISPPLVIVCECESLRKNVSQSDIVEDSEYMEFINRINKLQRDFSLRLATERIPSYQRELVSSYLLSYFSGQLPTNLCYLTGDGINDELRTILNLRFFTDTNSQKVSLAQILEAYQKDKCLLVSGRLRPRTNVKGLLIINPSEHESHLFGTLFDRIVQVDGDFDNICAEMLARRNNGLVQLPKLIASVDIDWNGIQFKLAVPNETVDSHSTLYVTNFEGSFYYYPLKTPGLSLTLVINTEQNRGLDLKAKIKQLMSEQHIESTAGQLTELIKSNYLLTLNRLTERLERVNRTEKFAAIINRANDHFASMFLYFWKNDLDRPNLASLGISSSELLHRLKAIHFIEDQQSQVINLLDVDAWLRVYPSLVICSGGAAYPDDYGLKATPNVQKLLGEVYGPNVAIQASVADLMLKERKQQRALAGCSQGPELIREQEETEEEELARLKQEFEASQQTSSPPTPDATPPAPIDAAALPLLFANSSPEIPTGVVDEEKSSPEEREANLTKAFQLCFAHSHKDFEVRITHGSTDGIFCVDSMLLTGNQTNQLAGKLTIIQAGKIVETQALSTNKIFGYIESPEEVSPRQVDDILLEFYQEMADTLRSHRSMMEPSDAESHKIALLRKVFQTLTLQNPYWAQEKGKLSEVPLVPTHQNTYLTLAELRRMLSYLGYIPYAFPGDNLPKEAQNVVSVFPPFGLSALESMFSGELRRVSTIDPEEIQDRLLVEIKRCVARGASDPRTALETSLVTQIFWGEPTRWFGGRSRYFVEHSKSGQTEFNPAHKIVKGILKSPKKLEQVVPILASSVYTAINRALLEVEDRHELAFLESLVEASAEKRVNPEEQTRES
jgi:hypothetical protein